MSSVNPRSSFFVAILLLCSGFAEAHPFHTSQAEIEWNSQSRRFEVALRVGASELEQELTLLRGTAVNLETTPGAEELVRHYLTRNITITTTDRPECRLHWAGMEFERGNLWCYFELEPTAPGAEETAKLWSADATAERPGNPQPEQHTGTGGGGAAPWQRTPDAAGAAASAAHSVAPETSTDADPARSGQRSGPVPEFRIRNSVLMALHAEQVNAVIIRWQGVTTAHHTTPAEPVLQWTPQP